MLIQGPGQLRDGPAVWHPVRRVSLRLDLFILIGWVLSQLPPHLVDIFLDLLHQRVPNLVAEPVLEAELGPEQLSLVLLPSQDHDVIWFPVVTQVDCYSNEFFTVIYHLNFFLN